MQDDDAPDDSTRAPDDRGDALPTAGLDSAEAREPRPREDIAAVPDCGRTREPRAHQDIASVPVPAVVGDSCDRDDLAGEAALVRTSPRSPRTPDDLAGEAAVARALDAWTPLAPPADFTDRVLAARAAAVPTADAALGARGRRRRWLVAAGAITATAAAALAVIVLRAPHRAAAGTLLADRRITAALGDRGLAVAEASSELTWRVDDSGAADVIQRSGNVFYRVERGGPFVVHTPAGDVRVTGTCFRIEVDAMNNTHKLLLSGAAGAAIASAVLVTVYEGHVIAETRGARTELSAGAHATLSGDSTTVADPALTTLADDAHASREQLLVRTREQQAQLLQLRARVAQLEHGPAAAARSGEDTDEPGRAWRDPSPERLAAWVATCHVRTDEPSLDRFQPGSQPSADRDLAPGEAAAYDAAMTEMAKRWKDQVRSLYLEVTGDTTGADSLSSEAMIREIEDKSPPTEHNQVLRKLARERAGLDAAPTDLSRTTALERFMRAHAQLGDQSEAALAKRLGPDRARAIRGDGWSSRSDSSGCPKDPTP